MKSVDPHLLPDLKDVLESIREAFFAVDKAWRFTYINGKAESILGRSQGELTGRCIWDEFPEVVTTPLYDILLQVSQDGGEVQSDALFAPNYRWLRLRAHPNGRGLFVYFEDVTDERNAESVRERVNSLLGRRVQERTAQLEKANKQLQFDAFHDTLTGMPNRTYLTDRLGGLLREPHPQGALLYLDFDRFKVINDSLGHAVGDALLIAIGECLTSCVRPEDRVARLGGDEFAILLDGARGANDAIAVVDRIQERMAHPFRILGHTIHISASVGIVMLAEGYRQPQDVLRDADLAMYRAKAQGKARYAVFEPGMRERAVALMSMESELRLALQLGQFQVHYQPIVELETGNPMGFEALARWQHPKHGFISPAEFIPLAEETGLIESIDAWVLREASRQVGLWQSDFNKHPPFKLSVNVSSHEFLQPGLSDKVAGILSATGFDASRLNLEITETLMMNNTSCVQDNLKSLETLGVGLHLDDFGTGYSSLGYLQRFPAHTIKIDRSFIDRLEGTAESSELVRTLISMAHNLEMGVVAEGVETVGQLAKLREMRCELVQGYLFSKPLAPAGAREFLNTTASPAGC